MEEQPELKKFQNIIDENIITMEDDYNYYQYITSTLPYLLYCACCSGREDLKRLEDKFW